MRIKMVTGITTHVWPLEGAIKLKALCLESLHFADFAERLSVENKMLKAVLFLGLLACASCNFVFPNFGNFVAVNVNDQNVITAANYAVQSMSNMWMGAYYHRLARIVGAWIQVVNGYTTFKLDIIAGVTTCVKQNVAFELLGQCPFQEGWATYRRCSVTFGQQKDGRFGAINSWACATIHKGDILKVTA